MHLRRVLIENFRGIERLELVLDPTTVLVGENNTGKSSVLDALEICIGPHSEPGRFFFRHGDFRRVGDDPSQSFEPIRISLTFREEAPRHWDLHAGSVLGPMMVAGQAKRRSIRLEVIALPPSDGGQTIVEWSFRDLEGRAIEGGGDLAPLERLRRLAPFVLLRADRYFSGCDPLDSPATSEATGFATEPDDAGEESTDELERHVEKVYHDLIGARGPLPAGELQSGLDAVTRWLDEFADRVPDDSRSPRRLLGDLVRTPWGGRRRGLRGALRPGAGMQSVGLLVLIGAFLAARGERRLSAEARPIVAVEEPEAHLHPNLVISVWRVIEAFPGQRILTTNSGELLAAAPLHSLRRMQYRAGRITVHRAGRLSTDELRRIAYHIRVKRGGVFFARSWLLVEGETEFWLLPELARLAGYDLRAEGVRLVEFAQCGVEPLVKLANDLGIEWHLLTDGDSAGDWYVDVARDHLNGADEARRVTRLEQPDIEHCLWRQGYADVYRKIAGVKPGESRSAGKNSRRRERTKTVIERAVRARSKPYLALSVLEAAAAPGSPGVPPPIRELVETVIEQARAAVGPD